MTKIVLRNEQERIIIRDSGLRGPAGPPGTGGGATALDDLTDVVLTGPSNGQVLKYNGTQWVNGTDSTGGGGSLPTGGTTGQVLMKASNTDGDAVWDNVSYTNLTPTSGAVGGVDAGTTFNDVSLTDLLNDLFYPYQSPAFSSFAISGQSTSVEVGTSLSGSKTFTWGTTNSSNVTSNSVEITQGVDVLATGEANDGSAAAAITTVQKTSAASETWTITGTNTNSATFTRNFVVNWLWRVYVGTSTNATLTESQIEALASNSLGSTGLGTYSLAAGGYKYFCWPTSLPAASGFTDASTLLNVSMATSADDAAYSNTANGFSYAIVSVTNAEAQATNYRVYRTRNQLGGSITVEVT